MNFRSISDLNSIVKNNLGLIPDDVELIVGVPRSGMLPATLLSVYLNLPLIDTLTLLSDDNHEIYSRDLRIGDNLPNSSNINDYKKILIIDDSCNTGLSIDQVKQKINEIKNLQTEVLYACVFVSPNAVEKVDIYFEIVAQPRVFEWNIMNHNFVSKACFDLDGVLCIDPTEDQNDDGENYIEFILNARPLYKPKFVIGAIVTSRLEKYRQYTEKWLKDNGIMYNDLIMLNLASKEERIKLGAHAPFKAEVFGKTDYALFVESDPKQAQYIAETTGKAVYCVTDSSFYDFLASRKITIESKESFYQGIISTVNQIETLRSRLSDKTGMEKDIIYVLYTSWKQVILNLQRFGTDIDLNKLDSMIGTLETDYYRDDYERCIDILEELSVSFIELLEKIVTE